MDHSGLRIGARLGAGVLLICLAVPASADYNKGVEAFKARDYATAVAEFKKVVEQSPEHAGSHYMLGLSLRAARQPSQALASLRKATELDPGNASYAIALGQTLVQVGQYNDAYLTLKKIRFSGLDARAKQSYAPAFATAAIKAGFPGEAIPVLEAQTKTNSKDAEMFYTLGFAYNETGDSARAFTAFKRAFDLKPGDQKNGESAVKAAISAGRRTSGTQKDRYYSQGADIAEKLAAASPEFSNLLLAGETRLGAGDFRQALNWFDKAKAKQPQNALIHFYRSQCSTSLSDYNTAIADLQQALKIGVDGKLRTQVYNQMGYVYDKTKRYDQAGIAYKNAGNLAKVNEMEKKKETAASNKEAEQEMKEYEAKLKALEVQIKELEAIGEVEEAKELRKHLEDLRKQ